MHAAVLACSPYLLIKLVDYAFCPLDVQVPDFGWSIDVCQLDTHLAHKESVILIGPINSWTIHIIHLLANTYKQMPALTTELTFVIYYCMYS